MHTDFCIGICPHCNGNGLIRPVRADHGGILYSCDESFHEFSSLEAVAKGKALDRIGNNNLYIPLEAFLEEVPEARGTVYLLKNGKWINMVNPRKRLF